ncbi:MAG: hypothetical protein DRN15_04100 [Thermoprotei archaeon]|nr:MAG: hypothetical protein DRN15_04100 [Thermoprotei archaeon]RLF25943.1 MAG: hypothetical protein DRM97_00100 [Thermoprotei archaeon]
MSVCPYLRSRTDGSYECLKTGSDVNPFIAPCLATYSECPYFKLEIVEERKEEEVKEEVEEKEEVVVKEEKPYTRVEEIENWISSLDNMWRRYEKEAIKVIEEWHKYRQELLRKLSSMNRVIKDYETELNEVEARRELGMIDGDIYERLIDDLNRTLEELRKDRDELDNIIRRIDTMLEPHYRRVRPSFARPSPSKIKLGLLKLEELYKAGKIEKEVYEKLKKELEEDYAIIMG